MTACSLSPALKCAGRFCPQVNAAPIPIEAGTNVGGLPNNWWYSFNIGNAHFVSLNSDVVTNPVVVTNTSRYHWNYPVSVQRAQHNFLAKDLAAADANRTAAPWIFVFAHYPMYCSSSAPDCHGQADMLRNGIPGHHDLAWEPLLKAHKVDMFVAAHMHSYERFLPVFNGSSSPRFLDDTTVIKGADSPVHIVTGRRGVF